MRALTTQWGPKPLKLCLDVVDAAVHGEAHAARSILFHLFHFTANLKCPPAVSGGGGRSCAGGAPPRHVYLILFSGISSFLYFAIG